jgi:hypothetical protein
MLKKSWPALFLISAACRTVARPSASPAANAAAPGPASVQLPPSPPAEREARPAQFLPTTVYSGGDGSSVEQAVVVMADSEQSGVSRENEWIFAHYGKFRKTGVGLATVQQRKLDVIRVELADHSEKEIFFDITSFFGKVESK